MVLHIINIFWLCSQYEFKFGKKIKQIVLKMLAHSCNEEKYVLTSHGDNKYLATT